MLNPRKQRRILQNPAFQGVLFAVAWLLVTNVTIYFIYLRSVEAVKGEIRDGLLRNVSMAATTLDGDTHSKFTAETQPNDPVYIDFIARMEAIRRASSDVRYMYTNSSKNGNIYFVANGAPQDDNDNDGIPDVAPQLMDPYLDAGNALKEALRTNKPTVSKEPYTDIWGTFYSAYAPFKDSKGNVVGTLGMDLELRTLQQRLNPIGIAAQRAAFTSGILAVLFGVAVWFFRSRNGILEIKGNRAKKRLQSLQAERHEEKVATAIQLEAVAQRVVQLPKQASDNYATALLRYASVRKGAPLGLSENFDPLQLIRKCLPAAVPFEVSPLLPSLVFGDPKELREILHSLCFSPFSNTVLGSLALVSLGVDEEQLSTLHLLITLRFQGSSSTTTGGAQMMDQKEYSRHVFDEDSLLFATSCEQVRALKGTLTHSDQGGNTEQVVLSLPYEKFREAQ